MQRAEERGAVSRRRRGSSAVRCYRLGVSVADTLLATSA